MAVINLYMAGLEALKARESQPDVVLLCLPQEVVDRCALAGPGIEDAARSVKAAPDRVTPM
jgi:hypothetical protein